MRMEMSRIHQQQTALNSTLEQLAREVANRSARLEVAAAQESRDAILSEAIFRASASPGDAAKWVAQLPAGPEQNRAALAVIERWIRSDPSAAANWAGTFGEGPLRQHALHLVARQWGLRDLQSTARWLENLPNGSSRDAAIAAFVTSADGNDIRLAVEWANRIADPPTRGQALEQAAGRWLREDPAAARQWIENAQLPDGLAGHLLNAPAD